MLAVPVYRTVRSRETFLVNTKGISRPLQTFTPAVPGVEHKAAVANQPTAEAYLRGSADSAMLADAKRLPG